jgi:hypothetical protein
MKDYNMPFNNAAIDKMSGKFGNGDPEPKMRVQTTKEVTVKPKKKGPVAKMGELETRTRATMIKAAETLFGFTKDMRTPHMQRILNKDAALYNERAKKEKMQDAKSSEKADNYRKKVESLQSKGYKKSGF